MQTTAVLNLHDYQVASDDLDGALDAQSAVDLPRGTKLLMGQYTIVDYLNCGGFGITYRAQDCLGRPVVIKECFPGDMAYRAGKRMATRSQKFAKELQAVVRNFVTEAHRLAAVRHENVVHVHQVFEENETAYMAMDHISGQDLLDILAEDPGRYGPREVQSMVGKLLLAIRHVHDLGMLHRDISPDNIIIDDAGEPILIDFGSARENAAQTSRRAVSKLKFVKDGYSPYEFYLAGSEQGTWSDLYSFAASMYHVIAGRAPEDAQKRLGALAAKQPDPYVPLAGNVRGYPTQFLKTLDKALSILPKNRVQTADEWLRALSEIPPAPSDKARDLAAALWRHATTRAAGLHVRDLMHSLVAYRNQLVGGGAIAAAVTLALGLTYEAATDIQTVSASQSPPLHVGQGRPVHELVAQTMVAPMKKPETEKVSVLAESPGIGNAPGLGAPIPQMDGSAMPKNAAPAARVAGISALFDAEIGPVLQVEPSELPAVKALQDVSNPLRKPLMSSPVTLDVVAVTTVSAKALNAAGRTPPALGTQRPVGSRHGLLSGTYTAR